MFARTHIDSSFHSREGFFKLESAKISETSTIARGDHQRHLIELFEKFTRSVDLDLNLVRVSSRATIMLNHRETTRYFRVRATVCV